MSSDPLDYEDYSEESNPISDNQRKQYGNDILGQYFENSRDRQLVYEKFLGCGADGVTYLIKQTKPFRFVQERNRDRSVSPKIKKQQAQGLGSSIKEAFRGPEYLEDHRAQEALKSIRIVLKIDKKPIGKYFNPGNGNREDSEEGQEDEEEEDEEDEDGCKKEKGFLQKLRGCKHIVRLIEMSDDEDPLLHRNFASINHNSNHGLKPFNWFFEEYLENGSLTKFLERLEAARKKQEDKRPMRLPNRLLWNIFSCLVKMVVGMAWPAYQNPDRTERPVLDQPLLSIEHADLHDGNLMMGSETDITCHSMFPVVKLIDFAGSQQLDDNKRKINDPGITHGVAENTFFIGKMMAILAIPELWDTFGIEIIPERGSRALTYSPFLSTMVVTTAVEFLPHVPIAAGIDDDIRILILNCLAVEGKNRPPIDQLDRYVQTAVRQRDSGYYAWKNNQLNQERQAAGLAYQDKYDVARETDGNLRKILQDFIFSPPPPT